MSDVKRVRYFNGEYLVANDFNQDQDYHRDMRYRHNKEFHSWGIVTGLVVSYDPSGNTPGSIAVIGPGLAADHEGREIVLDSPVNIDFDSPEYNAGDSYYITITWNQKESDPDENGKAKRWNEAPVISVTQQEPANPDRDLILTLLTLDQNKAISSLNNDGRTPSTINIGSGTVTSSRIAEADGVSAQDTNSGAGVKTGHIQDLAVTQEKLAQTIQDQLAALGTHDHANGNGAQINHSSLNFDDGSNPHGTALSQLTNLDANTGRIENLANPINPTDAANRYYVDEKTGATVSSNANISNVTNDYDRQINASQNSSATNPRTQVNASLDSTASGTTSQVNASKNVTATNAQTQVNASENSSAAGIDCQVNASNQVFAYGNHSQINASYNSATHQTYSQVNASQSCSAADFGAQVNSSIGCLQYGKYAVIVASKNIINNNDNRLTGGYKATGDASEANRKWELDSNTGDLVYSGNASTVFSDYGEFFENLKNGEIGMGVIIALEGAKVRPAKKDEDFIGVVSGTAAIRLGDTPFHWQGRYLKDKWGRPIYEEIDDPDWQPKKGQKEKDRPKIKIQKEHKEFDLKKEQIPRSQRPEEWTLVGLLGQVYVRCDKTVQPGDYIKSKANGTGTKAADKTRLRAMKITTPFDGKYAVVYCLLH